MDAGLVAALTAAWGSWAPSMSPDGDRVAYISDRRGRPELWVQDVPSPDQAIPAATPVAVSDDPVIDVHWSADGDWLAVLLATDGGVRSQVWVVRPDGRDARRVAGTRTQHATLGPWTRHGQRLVIGVPPMDELDEATCDIVDPPSGRHEALAHGVLVDVLDLSGDERFALLRDGTRGQQFVRVLDRSADRDYPVLPYQEAGTTEAGFFRPSPVPSPGVALVAYVITDAGTSRPELIAVPVRTDGTRGGGGVVAARTDADVEFADVDDSGRSLVLGWNVAGRSELELVDLVSGHRRVLSDLPGDVLSAVVMSRSGRRVIAAAEGPASPRRLWSLDLTDLTDLSWSAVTENGLAVDHPLVRPTLEHFVGYDGLPLSGWLYRPLDRAAPGPALLHFHGGPEAQERPGFSPQHQAVVAAGITVFAPNIRGSSGFGRTFLHADDRYGRSDAIADVARAAEWLIEQGIAPADSVAITGRSYGGYLTLCGLVWFPELFAAGIDICGMSDLRTFYRDTESWIAYRSVSKYGHPEHDADLLEAVSPLPRFEHVRAPVLIVHGELDTNVPFGEAVQAVARLRELDKAVEFVPLAGEGHEYRRRDSRARLLTELLDFLGRTLGT